MNLQSIKCVLLLILTSLFLTSCIKPYDAYKVGQDTFVVRMLYSTAVRGDTETANNQHIFRCAELTVQNGFDYFVVKGDDGINTTMLIRMYKGAVPDNVVGTYNAKDTMSNYKKYIEKPKK